MKNSLQKLLDKFPYFFNKSATSNFYKSQSVTNAQFQSIYQSLFDVVESFKLSKNCLIWKEQTNPYDYTINFVANFPYLKSVTLYKNDDVIYSDTFEYSDEIHNFEYSHRDSTLNDVDVGEVADIIPQHKFKIVVETFEEFTIKKGFPENDDLLGDEFDHDESLDEIGALHNVPRKEYFKVSEELYSATEPPYNDRLSEDDYHYMKRILEYMLRYHTTPLPILEIWKLYGIPATMENRERLLLKVFDLEKHPNFIDESATGDKWFSGTLDDTGEIIEWTPQAWEHCDKFCDYSDNLGKYFFVRASTKIPVKNQPVILYFKFLNSLAKELKEECSVDILLDNKTLYSGLTESQKKLESSEIPEDKDNHFTIIGRDSAGEIIGTQEIIITVRGCNNGNFYVNPYTGSDSNDGKSRNTAFKTIQKAVDSVNGDNNLVILLSGVYEINNPVVIQKDCTILACGGVLIENLSEDLFFTVYPGITLILQDMTLQYHGDICDVDNVIFTNNNGNDEVANVLILFTNAPIVIMTRLDLSFDNRVYCVGDTVDFTGKLLDKYGTALTSKTVSVSNENITPISCTTNNNGVYTGSVTATSIGNLTLNANYAGDSTYKGSNATASININLRLSSLLSEYDCVVMDLIYDEDTSDWNYITKPVSEINTLSDLDGAIINLQYNGFDVQFERFHSYSTKDYVSKSGMVQLRNLLVGIEYDDYDVKYMNAHLFGTPKLTLNPFTDPYMLVGTPFSFSGSLLDKYNNPLQKAVYVNNQRCTINSSGVFTGSITPTAPGTLLVTASFNGDDDYEAVTKTRRVNVRVPLATVLSDYDYVVTDLTYDDESKDWDYATLAVEDIEDISDLNNAVMNLTKVDGDVRFERFTTTSTNSDLTKAELESLTGLLVGIEYDDYDVKYTQIN